MIYGDDQCEECGAARVSGSRLCVGCMVRMIRGLEDKIINKRHEISQLEEKNKKLTSLVERLLDHMMEQGLYSHELRVAMRRAFQEQEGGM